MTKRLTIFLTLLACCFSAAMANQEILVKLDAQNRVYSQRVDFAYITFEYVSDFNNQAQVRVSVENITQVHPYAILVFGHTTDEKSLKKEKPKVEFEKIFPGDKGSRSVQGCDALHSYVKIVAAAETEDLFTVSVPFSSPKQITLPMYLAKYNLKKIKNGKDKLSYKIVDVHEFSLRIEVQGWSEDDPTYSDLKKRADDFIGSLAGVTFCPNKKHKPSLKSQQKPYQEKKDELMRQIKAQLDEALNNGMSTDPPCVAYTALLKKVRDVNLDSHLSDCQGHVSEPRPKKKGASSGAPSASASKCSYCSLSPQAIYHRLDDIYQRLHAGRITKEKALQAASPLYNCYQKHAGRSKDATYGAKISRFYNMISKY